MPSPFPIVPVFGSLVHVMRYEPHAKARQNALLAALRQLLGGSPLRIEATPEMLRVNDEAVSLDAPGASLVQEQSLLHGLRAIDLPAGALEEDFLRLATVLAAFPGTYGSHQELVTALGASAPRIGLTRGTNELEVYKEAPWQSAAGRGGAEADEAPPIHPGGISDFEHFQEVSIDAAAVRGRDEVVGPSSGALLEPRVPLPVLLQRGREATARADWHALLDVALQIIEAEAEAPSALAASTYRIELKRIVPRKPLGMIARMTHGDRKQEAILVLRRFGADSTELLMDLLVESNDLGERRGYYTAITQMNAGAESVMHHLDDRRWYVVRNSAEICGEMELAAAVPSLGRQAKHPDERVRKAVAGAFGKIATPMALEWVGKMLADPSPTVRASALAPLSGPRARGLIGGIGALLAEETDGGVQHEALKALGRIGSDEAIPILREWCMPGGKLGGRKPAALRLAGVKALEAIGPTAVNALTHLSRDADTEIRAASAAALEMLSPGGRR